MAIVYDPSKTIEEMAQAAGVTTGKIRNFLQRNGYSYKRDNDEYWRKKVIEFDDAHPNMTSKEMAKHLGISEAKLRRYFSLNAVPNNVVNKKKNKIFPHKMSVNSTDNAILRDILALYLPNEKTFDCDLTFGEGKFYSRGIQVPNYIFDKYNQECPKEFNVMPLEEINMIEDWTLNSLIIDLPVAIEETRISGDEKKGKVYKEKILKTDLNTFKSLNEMFSTYDELIRESARLLKEKGILIFKTADFVLRNDINVTYEKEWATDKAIEFALKYGFDLIDRFILLLNDEVVSTGSRRIRSALKHAVYLVFKKK